MVSRPLHCPSQARERNRIEFQKARVYDHFDMPLGAEAESRIRAAARTKVKGRHGSHRYDFGNTGWDPHAERERFAGYQQRYGVASEG